MCFDIKYPSIYPYLFDAITILIKGTMGPFY